MIGNKNSSKKLSIVNIRKKQRDLAIETPIKNENNTQATPNKSQTKELNNNDFPDKYPNKESIHVPPNLNKYYNDTPNNDEGEINISEYLEIVFHYKYLIGIILIVAIIVSIAYSLAQIPHYSASTEIFIQEDLIELQIINNKPMFKQSFDIKTWIQIIKSSDISDRVSDKLKSIYQSAEIQRMISCDVERDEEHIITISVNHTNQDDVAKISNTIFQVLQEYDAEQRSLGFYNSIEYLKTQMALKQDELDKIDQAISGFYKAKNIDAFSTDFSDNLSKVQKFQEMLQTAQVEYSAIAANITKIKADLNSEDNDIISQTSYSEPLKIRLMNLEIDLARASTNYRDQHPRVIAIQQNIQNVKKLISEGAGEKIQLKNMAANPVKQKSINDLLSKEGESIALEQKIIALKRIINKSQIKPSYQMELSKLQRERDGIKAVLLNLQNQLNSVNLSANIKSNRIRQLQKAIRPNIRINNKLKMNMLIAIVLGLGAGFGLALALHFLDNRIKSVSDFVKKINIPLIGTIPKYAFSPFLPFQLAKTEEEIEQKNIQTEASDAVSELLALNIKYMQIDEHSKAYAIVSPTKSDGKTSICLQLASAFNKEGYRVLLIDSDFYMKKSSTILYSEKKQGLSEILSAQVQPEDCIIHLAEFGFDLLPSGKQPPDMRKILASDRFTNLIEILKGEYNLILIDTPALLYVTDSLKVLPHTDGVILVSRILHTTYHELRKVIKRISLFNTEIIGTILNYSIGSFFDKEHEDYHQKYYSYKYKYTKLEDNDKNKIFNLKRFKRFNSLSIVVEWAKSFKSLFVFEDKDE